MSERRGPIGPVDIVVIGLLEHKWNQGKFTPLNAIRGKSRSLQDVAQVKQGAMTRHGHGIANGRPPRGFFVDQGDYVVSRERHVNSTFIASHMTEHNKVPRASAMVWMAPATGIATGRFAVPREEPLSRKLALILEKWNVHCCKGFSDATGLTLGA